MTTLNESVRFVPLSFAALKGWAEDDHGAGFAALLRSLRRGPADDPIAIVARQLGAAADGDQARQFFERYFTPHRVEDGGRPGLVTGYYEPELRGSRQPDPRFRFPVYRRPDDLVLLASDLLRAEANDRVTGFRDGGKDRVPYYTRAEIEAGALSGRGLELLYLEDPVELFFLQVQGSGLVHLTDGSTMRLTYAGKNGHPYTSIGRLLIERGALPREGLTMDVLKAWLRADPERGARLMRENQSYVFFRELPEDEASAGPLGAEGVGLTSGRSLAVDASYHRLGLPIFVAAGSLRDEHGRPFRRLMVAQDVGSAIRGPERGDIFFGTGETAGGIAGGVCHEAHFFILRPNNAPVTKAAND